MIDPSYTFILEALKNVQKEVGGEDSYDNGQNEFFTRIELAIKQFLESHDWSLISKDPINSINTQETRENIKNISDGSDDLENKKKEVDKMSIDSPEQKSKEESNKQPSIIVSVKTNFITKKRTRGRIRKSNSDSPIHGRGSFDNVQRLIQVNFINFIINFCNDAIRHFFKKSSFSFKKINQEDKIKVNFKNVSKLKKCSIKDLLDSKISTKYKNCDENENKMLLLKLKGTSLDELLEMNYLNLFKYYYNNNKESRLNEINFGKERIHLSESTESFCFLLKKNQDIKEKIIEAAERIYFRDNDNNGSLITTKKIFFELKRKN